MKVVVAGGGTSGHVLPAIAIAEALVDRGCRRDDVHYVGARRGVETRLVPPTGFPHTFFEVVGLRRSWSLGALGNNLRFLPLLIGAVRSARRLLRSERPDAVVSVGGYASLPAVVAARLGRIPVVVVSYDRRPGRASRLTARWAAVSATAFPGSDLPRAVHCGAPVRRSIRGVDRRRDRAAARRELGVADHQFLVVAMGGSLGSAVVNSAVEAFVRQWSSDDSLVVLHVVGDRFMSASLERNHDLVDSRYGVDHRVDYRVVGYVDRMESIYAAADLFVGRGGAGTVAEVATVGVPAVLVPWKDAADDHQTENVRWLVESGGAESLTDAEAPTRLAGLIDELRRDESRRVELGDRAYDLGRLNREGAVADVVVAVAERGATRG